MSDKSSRMPYHSKPGESLADTYNIPGIALFLCGIVGLACTLTAAGYGFAGWVILGSSATALCFGISITLFLLEHERLRRLAERRAGLPPAQH
ncbi:hypothetical protein [Nocardia brasiliensis]|uniref:UsfY protein n=1 Tax=Nocardia brasiliensis (strain ATCC 700358 / HUJEG-1) TaxID=1133849 RepID=K0EWV0_NOCB7|nr:hypothetical protein [Nocardia brasiliensis]AFU01574.1 hypothetical protein O3I_018075 [Nocardia brasiliensis ATCC 700358]